MTTTAEGDPDRWHGVHDSRERKRIQNRLAQRARRRRLAKNKFIPRVESLITLPASSSILDSTSASSSISCAALMTGNKSDCHTALSRWPCSVPRGSYLTRSPLDYAAFVSIVPRTKHPSDEITTEIPPNVFSALFSNGALMGLTCGSVVPAKSTPQPASVPLPLHPTALQLTTIHPRWIDRFPFPKMRDNMITLSGIVDEEEFLKDLFSMESFSIGKGYEVWDPRGWLVGREFARKWGYLFY